MIEIRIANQIDAKYIALLGRITFTETFGHLFNDNNDLLLYLDKTFSVNKIKSGLDKKNNVFLIAFYKELPVGFAKLKFNSKSEFIEEDKICQLQKIYVLKDFLSKKIGFMLQKELLKITIKNGNLKIWLSVLESNERAIKFYNKSGFVEVGKHIFQNRNRKIQICCNVKKIEKKLDLKYKKIIMIIKNLKYIPFTNIMDCFHQCFENYFVPFPKENYLWEIRWKNAKVDYSLSYGMFENEKLMGFIINAIDYRNGKLIAFNTGTGILPEYRGKRIVKSIYDYALKDLKKIK